MQVTGTLFKQNFKTEEHTAALQAKSSTKLGWFERHTVEEAPNTLELTEKQQILERRQDWYRISNIETIRAGYGYTAVDTGSEGNTDK
jgi:hypothetical protein